MNVKAMMTSSNGNIFRVTYTYTFVWGIPPVTGELPHKGHWHGALMFSLICAWINGWLNNRKAGDLRRHRAHYDVIVMNVRDINGYMNLIMLIYLTFYVLSFLHGNDDNSNVKPLCQKQCIWIFNNTGAVVDFILLPYWQSSGNSWFNCQQSN